MIAIENIYYILLYAWDHYEEGKAINLDLDDCPDLPNLFSNILVNASKRLIKKGLHKDYITNSQELSFIKGKVNLKKTLKKNTLLKGKIYCDIDYLNIDTIPNKIIKRTLLNLKANKNLSFKNKNKIAPILEYFEKCEASLSINNYLKQLKLNNNNYYYRLAINLCKIINYIQVPSNKKGEFLFKNILEDEITMSSVFETFIRNFYKIEQEKFKISVDRFNWDIEADLEASKLIPSNITDVTLRSNDKTIIIDTKYYKSPLATNQYGKKQVRPDHLRQIISYLMNFENREGPDKKADGILLYPLVEHQQKLSHSITWKNHKISFISINLNQEWKRIHKDLLELVA